jgi:uncharacterized protein YajQ (UPF0234 family)
VTRPLWEASIFGVVDPDSFSASLAVVARTPLNQGFMASTYSFDIVSDFDRQELVNAIDQTQREVKTRYDLKTTDTEIELGEDNITINTDSEFTLQTVHTVLQQKAVKRNLSLKIFDYGKIESASGSRVRQVITLKKGISKEIGKDITKLLRDELKKVQGSIQGDAVRVSSKSKDDLQEAIALIKSQDWPVALQFTNYR